MYIQIEICMYTIDLFLKIVVSYFQAQQVFFCLMSPEMNIPFHHFKLTSISHYQVRNVPWRQTGACFLESIQTHRQARIWGTFLVCFFFFDFCYMHFSAVAYPSQQQWRDNVPMESCVVRIFILNLMNKLCRKVKILCEFNILHQIYAFQPGQILCHHTERMVALTVAVTRVFYPVSIYKTTILAPYQVGICIGIRQSRV